jgi:hypothetical protein
VKNDDEVVSLNNGDALYLRDVQQEKGIKRPGADRRCRIASWRCGKEVRRKESAKPRPPSETSGDNAGFTDHLLNPQALRKYALF